MKPRLAAFNVGFVRDELTRRGLTLGVELQYVERTTSTNDDAKREVRSGAPHGACFVAETQTRGRGRVGRSWQGKAYESLLFSLILRPPPLVDLSPLTLAVGLGVHQGVSHHVPERALRIKWPNDLVSGKSKLGGILVETELSSQGAAPVVVGVGLNVAVERFPDELHSIATSLHTLGCTASREQILVDVLGGVERWYQVFVERGANGLTEALRAVDALQGESVRINDLVGEAQGIDTMGRLLVRTEDGTVHPVSSGTVEW